MKNLVFIFSLMLVCNISFAVGTSPFLPKEHKKIKELEKSKKKIKSISRNVKKKKKGNITFGLALVFFVIAFFAWQIWAYPVVAIVFGLAGLIALIGGIMKRQKDATKT